VAFAAENVHRVVISLGSNIDKERNLPTAVRLLAASTAASVAAVSPVYETAPVGADNAPPFFNAAVLLLTTQTAVELKDGLLSEIERELGRARTADKNAPRTIDLDIALYDDAVFDYTPADGRPRHVPDPDLRRFPHCLQPVADLLPDLPHPETGEPLGGLAERLLRDHIAGHGLTIWPRPDVALLS
jgi:2-amino-4-hydroxy-6-hydroxymethyldihydropteridine diphosphokinase